MYKIQAHPTTECRHLKDMLTSNIPHCPKTNLQMPPLKILKVPYGNAFELL